MAKKLDGILISRKLEPQIRKYARHLQEEYGVVPKLVAILVGDDGASKTYIKKKQEKCKELGCESQLFKKEKDTSLNELLEQIEELNKDESVHGILIQLPLPEQIEREKYCLLDALHPKKDVDALSSENTKYFYRGQEGFFLPCTPKGILTLLEAYQIEITGKHAVVIGRNDISGKPACLILGGKLGNATVTWCHRYSRNLEQYTREADILVSATGVPHLITDGMVKEGAVVIDVGIRPIEKEGRKKIVGDVDFEKVKSKASYITPVPGGIGPMTVISLMQNLVDGARYSLGLEKAAYTVEIKKEEIEEI